MRTPVEYTGSVWSSPFWAASMAAFIAVSIGITVKRLRTKLMMAFSNHGHQYSEREA